MSQVLRFTRPEQDGHGQEPDGPEEKSGRGGLRFGWWVLALGFGGFVAWASFAPLDNGVTMPGTVVVAGGRQAVDSLSGGVVQTLLVAEGDHVSAGQPLVRLDDTRASGEARSLRAQLAAAQARQTRLLAERDGADFIAAPDAASPELLAAIDLERQLFSSRRAALAGELDGIQASLMGSRAVVDGLTAALTHKRTQRVLMQQQVGGLRELAQEGYVPRNRLLELERGLAQLEGDMAADLGSIGQARQQMVELQARAQQRRDAFQEEVRKDLAQVGVQREQLTQSLASAEFEQNHAEVRAPATGTVVGLAVHTVGGVVQPGARLMEVVPDEQPLIVEGRLPIESIDKVSAGLPVELMFSAFDSSHTPRLAGQVTLVSADSFEDNNGGRPYYRLRAEAGPAELRRLGNEAALRAGMPVEVFVRTGERSMMNYLFKPLFDRAATAWGG